jgi:hypothetical protein
MYVCVCFHYQMPFSFYYPPKATEMVQRFAEEAVDVSDTLMTDQGRAEEVQDVSFQLPSIGIALEPIMFF